MKQVCVSFLLMTIFTFMYSCSPKKTNQLNNLTSQEQEEGWELLFDGKKLDKWHKYGGTQVGKAWIVDDDAIHLSVVEKDDWQAKDGGDIVSEESYENFHLKLDWKISEGGNSGIIFYVLEDTLKYDYPWLTGPEMQVLDNTKHTDSKNIKHRAGDLYDLISCREETVLPPGQWNKVEIISNNGKLVFMLNGVSVVETTLWTEEWYDMIAKSKFAEFPDFGRSKTGKISLQDHGDSVWYRNIKIKRL